MRCAGCGGKGIARIANDDGDPDDFGVCWCPDGRFFRDDRNAYGKPTGYPRWQVWAAANGIAQERMFHLEDLLNSEQLSAAGYGAEAPQTQQEAREAALLNASRKRPRL